MTVAGKLRLRDRETFIGEGRTNDTQYLLARSIAGLVFWVLITSNCIVIFDFHASKAHRYHYPMAGGKSIRLKHYE